MVGLLASGVPNAGILAAVLGIALAVLLGKAILQATSDLTGLTFFFTLPGIMVFYLVISLFSVIIAPIFCLWSLFRYSRTVDE